MRLAFRLSAALVRTLALAVALFAAANASADLGAVVIDQVAGPYRVIAFAAPTPVRAGSIAWTIVALDADSAAPAQGVVVAAHFEPPFSDEHEHHAGHGRAPVGLESRGGAAAGGSVVLDAPGDWRLVVDIEPSRRGSDAGPADRKTVRFAYPLEVGEPRGFLRQHGLALAAPYAAILLFVVHQLVVGRSARRVARRRG